MMTDEDPTPRPTELASQPEGSAGEAPRMVAPEMSDRAILAGAPLDHALADQVAALTSTPQEAEIDARMGLRGTSGRQPRPEDFTDVLSDEGNAGGVLGADISGSPFVYGEDGSTRVP